MENDSRGVFVVVLIQVLTGARYLLCLRTQAVGYAGSVAVGNWTAINAGFELATTEREGSQEESKESPDSFHVENSQGRNAQSQLDICPEVFAIYRDEFIGACAGPQGKEVGKM